MARPGNSRGSYGSARSSSGGARGPYGNTDKKRTMRKKRKRVCLFCAGKRPLDYKDVNLLRKYITDRGKIAPRRMSSCCAYHQRQVAKVIKMSRQMGLAPYVVD